MNDPILPDSPTDGFTIEWWSFENMSYTVYGPRKSMMIYIADMTWQDFVNSPKFKQYHHYNAKTDTFGAAFTDQWIHLHEESDGRFHFTGRSDGWNAPLLKYYDVSSPRSRWIDCFATREDCLKACHECIQNSITQLETKTQAYRVLLESIV